jgi:threo-3-hydroxy-L-aspartate ammonia-lyase
VREGQLADLLDAIRRLARQARLIAEPGGAAAVAAALYRGAGELGITSAADEPVIALLSGGNIDPALLAEILQTESYTG